MPPAESFYIFVLNILCFIKPANQLSGKQINADNRACADKDINSENPSSCKTGVSNRTIEKKILGYILRAVSESNEDNIQQQQEKTHCHAEQPDKGNKLPVLLECLEQMKSASCAGSKWQKQ